MRKTSNFLSRAALFTVAAGACVASMASARPAFAAETTTLHDHATIAPLQLIEGHYESPKKSAECVKLQTKLMAKRTALKASSEWRTVTGSDAYKTFEDSHKNLAKQSCGTSATGPDADACKALTDKVKQEANALSETTQWKALTASKSWGSLLGEFAAAEKAGCIVPKPPKEAVK